MPPYPEADQIKNILNDAQRIVIMQADNPDGDSIGSALALEQILGDMGKQTSLYCGVEIPQYLSYLEGWDRISKDIPNKFDAAIIVDTSTETLFENLAKSGQRAWVAAKPVIVLDHHAVDATIPYAAISCNKTAVATGEVIHELAQQLDWPLNHTAKKMIMTTIMSDSLGLTTEATTARTIAIVSELVAGGVKIVELEQARREMMRKSPELIQYKGKLLQRIEYYADNRVATVTIPWAEIEKYSPQYNPSMLVIDDMRMALDTQIAIAFKLYSDGHITAKIRCNYGYPIANELAKKFGGGGHAYASGFKIVDGRPFNEVKSECIHYASQLLDNLEQDKTDETLQHTDA
jgi:phosphoesterase RecJ-like protein